MSANQLALPFISYQAEANCPPEAYRDRLVWLLSRDLGFHDEDSSYASHNFHSFPAKFPPHLPRLFIDILTSAGDVVLDPMSGSGTTVLEAFLAGRQAIGFDIDPLALLLTKVKVTPLDQYQVGKVGHQVIVGANSSVRNNSDILARELERRWDARTQEFIDYWFARQTQIELLALLHEIERVSDPTIQAFLLLTLSSVIITKSGGVSLARDLGHTRPHRVKVVYASSGTLLEGQELLDQNPPRLEHLIKTLRSPLDEFEKRLRKNMEGIRAVEPGSCKPRVEPGNAQSLPLEDNTADLIVTSPPYASNAIDYMRAHKFSLVWLGYPVDDLGQRRRGYIGGEAILDIQFEALPAYTERLVSEIAVLDVRKGLVLRRYYSEMTRVLREMFRILKPSRAAIVVVGSSVMRGQDIEVGPCLADIGQALGFSVPKIGVRGLDRDRRMMPTANSVNRNSQIQQRMHEEYVLGLLKPG